MSGERALTQYKKKEVHPRHSLHIIRFIKKRYGPRKNPIYGVFALL